MCAGGGRCKRRKGCERRNQIAVAGRRFARKRPAHPPSTTVARASEVGERGPRRVTRFNAAIGVLAATALASLLAGCDRRTLRRRAAVPVQVRTHPWAVHVLDAVDRLPLQHTRPEPSRAARSYRRPAATSRAPRGDHLQRRHVGDLRRAVHHDQGSAHRGPAGSRGLNPSTPVPERPVRPALQHVHRQWVGHRRGRRFRPHDRRGGRHPHGLPVSTSTACTSLLVTPNTSPAKDLAVTTMAPSPNTVAVHGRAPAAELLRGHPHVPLVDRPVRHRAGQLFGAALARGPHRRPHHRQRLRRNAERVGRVQRDGQRRRHEQRTLRLHERAVSDDDGADRQHRILYPYPGTVFPLGLPSPLIQWRTTTRRPTTASAVKVTLQFPTHRDPHLHAGPRSCPSFRRRRRRRLRRSRGRPSRRASGRTSSRPSSATAARPAATRSSSIQRYVGGHAVRAGADHHSLRQRPAQGQRLLQLVRHEPRPELRLHARGSALRRRHAGGRQPTGRARRSWSGYNDPTLSGAGCRVCHNAAASGSLILSNSYLTNGNSGGGSEATTFSYNPTLGTPALIQGSQASSEATGATCSRSLRPRPDGTYLFTSAAPRAPNWRPRSLHDRRHFDHEQRPERPARGHAGVLARRRARSVQLLLGQRAARSRPASGDGKSLAMMDFSPPKHLLELPRAVDAAGLGLYSVWPSFLPPGQNGDRLSERDHRQRLATGPRTRSHVRRHRHLQQRRRHRGALVGQHRDDPGRDALSNTNGGTYLPRSALNGTLGVTKTRRT